MAGGAAVRFAGSASPRASTGNPASPDTVHRAHRSGHAGCGVAAVCAVVGERRPSCQERAVLQRSWPPTRCGDERWAARRARRRRAEGGRDGGWRLRVAAVAYCEAADCVVNSASPRAAAPRSLDATLACHRQTTSTRRRPTAMSTGARRRRNGASVSRTLTEYSCATRMRWGWAPRDCEGTHTEC
jgi:hypothetical protein